MQLDRKFLFIAEVESYFGFTKYDLIDYLNQGRLKLYAWTSLTSIFGFCKISNNEKSSIIGCFDYKGIIKIDNSITPAILGLNEPVNIFDFVLTENQNIRNWQDKKPHNLSYPNALFLEYKFVTDDKNYEVNPLIGALDSFDRQSYNFEQINNPNNVLHQDFSEDNVIRQSILINPSDLRVSRTEIEKIISQNAKHTKKSNLPDNLAEKKTSPIDELIIRLIRHGITSSSEMINIFKAEAKKSDDERLFDVFGIILEANNKELVWLDTNQQERTLAKKTLQNKLSEFKKGY